MAPVVEAAVVGDSGERAGRVAIHQHPGEVVAKEGGEADTVAGVAHGVPDPVDLAYVGS
jgi:hypothetical protein